MEMCFKFDNSWFSWNDTEVLHGAKFTWHAKRVFADKGGRIGAGLFGILVNGNLCVWLYAANARLCDCVCVCMSVYALLISRCTEHFLAHLILAGVLEEHGRIRQQQQKKLTGETTAPFSRFAVNEVENWKLFLCSLLKIMDADSETTRRVRKGAACSTLPLPPLSSFSFTPDSGAH